MQVKCTRCNGTGQIRGAMQKLIACNCCNGRGYTEMTDNVIHEVVNGLVQISDEEVEAFIEEKKKELNEPKKVATKEERSEAIRKGMEKSKALKEAKRTTIEITNDAEKEADNFLDSISTDAE